MKKLSVLSLLLLLALCTPLAHATMELSYSITGVGGAVVCASGASGGSLECPTFTVGGVTVEEFSSTSNSPGGIIAFHFNSTLKITNASAGTVTLDLWAVDQGFTTPAAPPAPGIGWGSSLSTDQTIGTTTVNMTSCLDTTNGTAPPTDLTFCSAGPTITHAPQVLSGFDSDSETKTLSVAALGTPYSMGQHFTLELAAGTAVHVQGSHALSAIPEPASMVLLGTALLGLTVAFRKKLVKRS